MKPVVLKKQSVGVCPQSDGNKPHGMTLSKKAASSVFVENKKICRKGDELKCSSSPKKNEITSGSSSVFVEDKPIAFLGSSTSHGGSITMGCSTSVFICE